jgi:hypothetical protein
MTGWRSFAAIGVLAAGAVLALGSNSGIAQPRAHVYLLRGLANIFSLGMDTLADELNERGVYTTVDNYAHWQSIANQAAANYKAGTEGPIILIGHSLGADAVMEMAAYLGKKGVPVALVVPFDGTHPSTASPNVARVFNLTQRVYARVQPEAGFRGSLANVDVSSDPNINHLNIDKSPRLHAQVISEVLAVVSGHVAVKPKAMPSAPAQAAAPPKSGSGAMNATQRMTPGTDKGAPINALSDKHDAVPGSESPAIPPPPKAAVTPMPRDLGRALPD